MAGLLALAAAWFFAATLRKPVAAMLAGGPLARNFRGQEIPTGMGLCLLLALLPGFFLLHLGGFISAAILWQQAFWLALVSLAGLADDAWGNKKNRGFRGHFRALAGGQLTTGVLKVLAVGLGALLYSLPLTPGGLVAAGVLALSVNAFNQLDLRPGRALKGALFILGGLALAGSLPAALGCGASLALLPGDLKAQYMLGDAGANLLGALVGLALVALLDPPWHLVVLALLALVNGAGELFSITRLIEGSKLLRWIDQIGRPQAGK